MPRYEVMVESKQYNLVADSIALAAREGRERYNEPVIKMMRQCDNERDREKFYNKHREEIMGPKTVVVKMVGSI